MDSPIGFVGLGIMGKGKSLNASVELASLYPGKVEIAASAKECVERCKFTFSMLSTLEASIATYDGEDGVVAGVSEGKVIIDCATLTPERMIDEAARVTAKGGRFLEAPVSGSKVPAEQGQLIFLCGGDEMVFQDISPALNVMGKANFFFGQVGQGSRMKIAVNMVMGSMLGALAEGMALCEHTALSTEKLLQVLDLGAMGCALFRAKGPVMVAAANNNHDKGYDTNFPLKHQQKDMKFAIDLAQSADLSVPIAVAANEQYMSVLERHGDDDFSAVVESYRTK
eukprot:gene9767-20309_t